MRIRRSFYKLGFPVDDSLTVLLHDPQLDLLLERSTQFPEQQSGCFAGHRRAVQDVKHDPQ